MTILERLEWQACLRRLKDKLDTYDKLAAESIHIEVNLRDFRLLLEKALQEEPSKRWWGWFSGQKNLPEILSKEVTIDPFREA